MRLRLTLCTLAALLLCCGIAQADGWVFGVKPGGHINTSYFGIERGNFVFYGGLDLVGIGVELKESGTETYYDWWSGEDVTYTYESEMSGSALLIIPRVGAKFRISSHSLRPYLFADVFKVFPSVSLDVSETYNGQTQEMDNSEMEDLVSDVLGAIGFNFGFGAEYYFSEHFSMGGEYAIRWFTTSATDEGSEDYGGYYGAPGGDHAANDTRVWEDELSASLKMSYATIVLNYYF